MEKDKTEPLEKRLNELVASKRLVETSRGPMWLYSPTLEDRIFSKHIYDTRYASLLEMGVLPSDKMLEEYIEQGLWEDTKEKNLGVLPGMIEEVQERVDRERNRVKKKKLERWLHQLYEQYNLLLNERNTRLANSAEYLAHDSSLLYLLWASLHNHAGERPFQSFEDIEEGETEWVEELLSIYIENTRECTEEEIRAIARSSSWRIRWNAFNNDCCSLFGKTAQHLTNEQFLLIYWSQVYDSVYESLDRPPDDVILNDEALDKWLLDRHEERNREIGQKFYSKGISKKGNPKIENAPEVYKAVDGYFDDEGRWHAYTTEERWQKVEKIRNLNSPTSRRLKQIEEDRLRQTPGVFIQEGDLRKKREHREAMGGNVTVKGRR